MPSDPVTGEEGEVINDDDIPDPDKEVDNLTQLRKAAGLPELIADDLPSSNATKMMSLLEQNTKWQFFQSKWELFFIVMTCWGCTLPKELFDQTDGESEWQLDQVYLCPWIEAG